MKLGRSIAFLACLILLVSALAAAPAVPFKIDKNHSTVGFTIPILGGLSEVTGKFTDFDVQLNYDDAEPALSTVSASIKTASIDTGIDDRNAHLRTADFFDAEKYPDITFKSKKVSRQEGMLMVTGDFTMHGVTKEIVLPVKITGKNGASVGFAATLPMNRKDYGINWKHSVDPLFVADELTVQLRILGRPAAK
jgi:polyisoprenoid-binding protein YceI